MKPVHPYSLPLRVEVGLYLGLAGAVLAFCWGGLQQVLPFAVPWWVDAPAIFGFYGLLYALLDQYAWRVKRIGALLRVPDLRGTWTGVLRSSKDDLVAEHEVTIVITQSWSTMRVVLEGRGSTSHSIAAHVSEGSGTELHELVYEYENTPRSGAAMTMQAHRGTAHLRLLPDGCTLEGGYYTGRGRQNFGEIRVQRAVS